MSKVIEISDSDDEADRVPKSSEVADLQPLHMPSTVAKFSAKNAVPAVVSSGSMSPPLVISDVTSINVSPLSAIASVHRSPTGNNGLVIAAAGTSSGAIIPQNKRSRRKSMHHPLCVSPEIEFETIALDDDEDNTSTKSKNNTNVNSDGVQQNKSPKSHKTTPKILNIKSATANLGKQLSDACTELLISDETTALLHQIAEDRVRINFLLASYNMPEIQFSLETKPEVLQFQLEERIKHRRRRSLEASNVQKKRRTLLQTNNARTGS
ncbi:uncharacterized protein LOC129247583 [Anastrepha obliqua]|uniref:uncharacterized protein LOC129247583 n=1 Tax=Anastrepha obliqua TaxID=95512 RepID=UPI0024096A1E|nr:uncharacterized protein LOC129247583 [Anastrepha obliqua]